MTVRSLLAVVGGAVALLGLVAAPSIAASASVAVVDDAYRDSSSGSNVTTITAGDTVVWSWAGSNANLHTVTALSGGFDSDSACGVDKTPCRSPGHTYSRTFKEPGTYQYRCKVHLTMLGTVQVQAPPSDDGGDDGGSEAPKAPSAPSEPRQESPDDSGSGDGGGSGSQGGSSGSDGSDGTQGGSAGDGDRSSGSSSGSSSARSGSSSSGASRSYGPRRAYVPGLDFQQGGTEDLEPSVEDPAVAPAREAESSEAAEEPGVAVASEAPEEPTETETPDEVAIQFPDDPGEARLRRIGAALMAGGLVIGGGITGRRFFELRYGSP